MQRTLFSYWRSSASYRVRIALALKGLAYETVAVDLRAGEQHGHAYRARNPQGRVPWFTDGDFACGQSLAVIEWLEETYPGPRLLPADPAERARVRAAAQLIACDIAPLGNVGVLQRLRQEFGADQPALDRWGAAWIEQGFAALEPMADAAGPYVFGGEVTLADVLLVPQMFNARRFGADLSAFPRLVAADAALGALPAFAAAHPVHQPDAPPGERLA